jgi:Tol biopolymer transport system component
MIDKLSLNNTITHKLKIYLYIGLFVMFAFCSGCDKVEKQEIEEINSTAVPITLSPTKVSTNEMISSTPIVTKTIETEVAPTVHKTPQHSTLYSRVINSLPVGLYLMYADEDHIYIQSLDSEIKIEILDIEDIAYASLSNKKDLLVYNLKSNLNSNPELKLRNLLTDNEKVLLNSREYRMVEFPSWSYDDELIIFSMVSDDVSAEDTTDLYAYSLQKNEIYQITKNQFTERNPKWSPDGKWIAFQSDYEVNQPEERRVYILPSNCKDQKDGCSSSKFDLISEFSFMNPTWSPTSDQLAFTCSPDNQFGICISELDGENLSQLYKLDSSIDLLTWSPDGDYFAYIEQLWNTGDKDLPWQNDVIVYSVKADDTLNISKTTDHDEYFISWVEIRNRPQPQLKNGQGYKITEMGDNLNLRQEPAINSKVLRKLKSGEEIFVLDGPEDKDGYYWWFVQTNEELEGWVAEGFNWFQKLDR